MTDEEINQLKVELDRAHAANSVAVHLILALFDATEDKKTVIEQFKKVTSETSVLTLYSGMSDEFYQAFEEQRNVLVQILGDTLS